MFDSFNWHYTTVKHFCWIIKRGNNADSFGDRKLSLNNLQTVLSGLENDFSKRTLETKDVYEYRKLFATYLFILIQSGEYEDGTINIAQLVLIAYGIFNKAAHGQAPSNEDYNKAQKAVKNEFDFYEYRDVSNIRIGTYVANIFIFDMSNTQLGLNYINKFN